MKIAFIGGGVMGEAMIGGLLAKQVATPKTLWAADARPERAQLLAERFGVHGLTDNRAAVDAGDIVVLAIKPQNLREVLAELRGRVREQQMVLSIVAGARLSTLTRGLGHQQVVRAIPNTPGQVGEGITVWTASEQVSGPHREAAREVLRCLGAEVYVPDEAYIDMATAVSSSGPAYVYLFIEALIDAAVHIGFPRDMAQQLVLQTVRGSAAFAQLSGKHPAELKNMVTSPGGTTVEGLLELEAAGLRAAVTRAVIAAHNKAKALGSATEG
ncbi:MAG: pyrroline-5-carboxylate reductase [Dehalococcoidia bacterium]|nr:pyrroline-5-carboxylate reductase [Dehalococcoidia bacterium]